MRPKRQGQAVVQARHKLDVGGKGKNDQIQNTRPDQTHNEPEH